MGYDRGAMSMKVPLDPRNVEIMDEDVARVLRTKTGAERLQIAFGMYSSARRMLTRFLTTEHPEWSEEQVREEVGRRLSHGYSVR
jgi:Rv0078B-related antitoxin